MYIKNKILSQMEKVSYMLVIGYEELESRAVAVKSRKSGDLGAMPIEQFINNLVNEIDTKAR